ncbi:MAG: iron-sulfur cluster assembly scaffold protein [Candidatus Babeliaceae bacterium]|nr:iron-sulfur cluster assembly scaffold protein [Candidatus Babeliaceae bacterium]
MSERPALYNPEIMKLYRTTPYRGTVENPSFITEKVSPSCGDRVVFSGIVKDDHVVNVKFSGEGSMVTQVVASILCELALNKPIIDILKMGAPDIEKILHDRLNLELGPTRFEVVLFVLDVLQQGLAGYDGSCPGCARITEPQH